MRFPPNPFAYNRDHLCPEHDPSPESIKFDCMRPRGRRVGRPMLPVHPTRCSRCGGPGPIIQINNGDAGCLDCNLEYAVERATAYILMEG